MKKLLHISILLVAAGLVPASSTGQTNGPLDQATAFSCRLLDARHFTNVERIPVEVRLKSKDLEVDQALLNPSQTPKPLGGTAYLELFAEQVAGKERKPVPLKLSKIAEGRDFDESYVRFLAEIPIDEQEKKAKISKHLDDLVREAQAKGNVDTKTLRMYQEKNSRQALMNTFDRLYIQNRTGAFLINCRYTANSSKHAGMLQSRPIQVTVDFKSDFLDQPMFH